MLTIKTHTRPNGEFIGVLQNGKSWTIQSNVVRLNRIDALHDAAMLRLEYLKKNKFNFTKKSWGKDIYSEALSLKRNLDVVVL